MYRFRPVVEMKAYPISEYPVKCRQAAAIMHMIMNNLDPRVAQVWIYTRERGREGGRRGEREREREREREGERESERVRE